MTLPSTSRASARRTRAANARLARDAPPDRGAPASPGRSRAPTPAPAPARFLARVLACVLALITVVRAQDDDDWSPAICGGASRAADHCAGGLLEDWEEDVRALQFLSRACDGDWDDAPWRHIPDFDGTRDDWIAVCDDAHGHFECDDRGGGRVVLLDAEDLDLECAAGLPIEFERLAELKILRMNDSFKASRDAPIDVADVLAPLRHLENLEEISLNNNGLVGRVPPLCSFASFDRALEILSLAGNALSGAPTEDLGCLTSLRALNLAGNRLDGQLPDAWRGMSNLEDLIVSDNERLGTIPAAWFDEDDGMRSLRTLVAFDCGLTGEIPANIGVAAHLRELRLGNGEVGRSASRAFTAYESNAVTGSIPASLASLEFLTIFDATRNTLEGTLPENLFESLRYVEEVRLGSNRLNGTIPILRHNRFLRTVDLSENAFEGDVPELGASLERARLAGNNLGGAFPNLSESASLEMLDLSRNALTGALSNTVPDTLEILDASENRLSSGLGDWLGKGRLVEVILAENDFEGELPSAVCNAHTVRVDLSGNALRGALPESIEECVKLETLKIGGVGGGFGGGGGASLPSAGAFEKLARLTELSLPGFGLVGAIPTSVFAISKLRVLNLADNQLSGTIPAVSSTSLVEIRLDGNALEGDVPLSLLTLPELTALFLSENRLTGMEAPAANDTTFATEVTEIHLGGNRLTSIPEVLRNVTELESLNLSRNDIAGPVPTWLGLFSRLRELDLSENRLSGSLAGWLGDHHALRDLEDLRVGGNVGIEGPLSAASIRSLARLKTLNLTGVGRFGAFPIAAGTPDLGLVSLVNLIAANAGFTGRLPPRMFDALPNLVHLDLRGNALEGSVPADVAPAEESLVENFSSERSSPEARVLTHAALRCLLLSENAFSGVFPRLDAPAYYLATSFSSTGSDASTLLGVVDFSDAGRFDCPLPDRSVVYDTASCACAAGRAGPDDGRYECDDCPPGSFSNLESSEACAPCAAGEVSAAPGASSCDACPPGTFATAGSATCAKCAAGTFASTSRAGACDACPPGEHQPVEGETSCVKCAAGSSASTPGSATCAFCPAGAFSSAAGSTTCESCPAGTWQNATGQTACADCPAGTANAAEGANDVAACAPCPPGTSTGGDRAAAACEPCAAGTYAGPTPGAERCAPAPKGHRVANVGAVAPERCPAGAYAPNAGAEECLPCPANQYREDSSVFPEDEAAEAAEAEAETAADATTAEASSEEASETSTEASETSTSDPYSASIFHDDGSSCAACPSGARSDAGWSRCECLPGHAPSAVSGGGLRCDACAPGTFLDLITSTCAVCPAGTFAPANASVACAPFSPGSVGSEYVEPESYRGATAQRLCDAGSVPRRVVVRLAVVSLCAPCPAGTISSAAGAVNCTACALGSAPNPERTACASANDALDWSSTDGAPSDDASGNVTDAGALAALALEAARRGTFAGESSAAAFFALLGSCAVACGGGAAWLRRRRRRLRRLALERRVLLEDAEADFARGKPVRRETLYALAGVDAEAAALGDDGTALSTLDALEDGTALDALESERSGSKPRTDASRRNTGTFVEKTRGSYTRRRSSVYDFDGLVAAARGVATASTPREAAERRVSARYRAASVAAAAAAQNRRRKSERYLYDRIDEDATSDDGSSDDGSSDAHAFAEEGRGPPRRWFRRDRREGRDRRDRRWFRRDRRWFRRDRRAGGDAAEEAAAAAAEAVRVAVRSASVSYRDAGAARYPGAARHADATPEDRTNASNEAAGTALPPAPEVMRAEDVESERAAARRRQSSYFEG